ncbi:Tachykinin-like peptides receptor 99D, partial [Trichoplax sp. H2]
VLLDDSNPRNPRMRAIIILGYWSYGASVHTLIVISYERYNAILRPTAKLSRKKAKSLCGIAWLTSLPISIPFLVTGTAKGYQCTSYTHHTSWVLVSNLTLVVFQFIIPITVMITTYSLILRQLRFKVLSGRTECTKNKQLKRRTVYMVMLTTAIFFVCALPWTLSQLIEAFTGKFSFQFFIDTRFSAFQTIIRLSRILLPVTALYNPIIYCIFNEQIRKLFFPCCYWQRITAIQIYSSPTSHNRFNKVDNSLSALSAIKSEFNHTKSTLTAISIG